MVEKELMVRLRRNGEIVGFMWLKDGDVYGVRGNDIPISFSAWIAWGPMTMISHDSFDLGTRIDSKWTFLEGEGDAGNG